MIYTVKRHYTRWLIYRVDGEKLYPIGSYETKGQAKTVAHLLAGFRGKVI